MIRLEIHNLIADHAGNYEQRRLDGSSSLRHLPHHASFNAYDQKGP